MQFCPRFMILTYHDWRLNHSFYASQTHTDGYDAETREFSFTSSYFLNDYDRFQLIFKWSVSAGGDFYGCQKAKISHCSYVECNGKFSSRGDSWQKTLANPYGMFSSRLNE